MKKSLLLLTLMVLLTPWAVKATELTIYEDATGTSTYVPVYGTWADAYLKCEFVVPADELLALNGGTISQMSFHLTSPAEVAWTGTFQVFLQEVTEATISAYNGSDNATVVYEGTLDATGSTMDVAFTTNYAYNGGNLLVGVYQIVKGNYKAATFSGKTVNGACVQGYSSSSLSGVTVTQRNFIPKTTFTYSGGTQVCGKPTNLQSSEVTHEQATISWTSEVGAYTLEWKPASEENWNEESLTDNSFQMLGLEPLTAYDVRVKAICGFGESLYAQTSFSTTAQAEEVGDAWADDFEGSLGWELINGELTNAWVLGAAVSNGGTHSLYISNDGGITNAYSNDKAVMVYAAKLLNFAEGKFEFSFDWLANGESTYDYLRVALVPASVTLTAGTSVPSGFSTTALPTGWIALDGGGKLNLITEWQHQTVAIDVPAGNYYLVLAWRDDTSGGSQPPAAVDNVSITKIACEYDVAGLAVANITTDAAALSWTNGEAENWQVAYSTSSSFEGATEEIVSEASYQIGGLDPATTYYAKVRAYCGGDDFGAWSDVISFVTECEALDLSAEDWSENFDALTVASSYSPSSQILPVCWKSINTTTYASNSVYPTVYYYSYTDYSHSTPNSLRFNSTYSSYSNYDPQPQYAILPVMDNLAGRQITLWARGANATSTFKVGLISNPADASTFEQIAEQALTTAYEEFNYIIPSTATAQYVAIMIEAASSSRSTNGVYIDDISIHEAPSCEKPIELAVEGEGQTATFTWTSDAGAFEIAHATSATADPEENIAGDATENSFVMSDLALDEDHYFWVRSDCGSDGKSIWAGPVSVHIGYCVPAPSSRDSEGITGVVFGVGDDAVNNSDENGLPNAAPFYGDYSAMIGAVQAGVESTIAITTSTGNYPYGIVIWVDFNNNLSFEDDEIVYKGQCTTGSGTLNAAITVPATQALGDYRMRIGGADSYFDSFIGGSATAAHDPCYSGTYTVFHDYTLRVLEAPSCLAPTGLAVEYNGGTEATISWTSDASSFNMKVNGTPIDAAINSPSYVLGGLELATTYSIEVQANCGSATSDWTSPVSFTTDFCMPENMCELTFVLHDSYGDGWNGNAINVVDVATNEVIASMEADNHGGGSVASTDTKKLAVCDGRAIQFVWETGSYATETSYEVYDIQGQEIFSGSGAMSAPVDYTVDCPSCFKPKELAASNIASSTADLSWTAGASETQWVLQYSEDSEFANPASETIDDNPSFQLTGLEPEHTYYVRVKAVCGSDDESDWVVLANPIITLANCPVPSDLSVSNDLAHSVVLAWTADNDSYNIQYRKVAGIDPIFSEGFESGSLPDGWTIEGNGTWNVGTGDYSSNTGAHSGSYNAKINHGTTGDVTYLVTPEMDFSSESALSLGLWYINRSWAGDNDGFGVCYRVNGGEWNELFATSAAHADWTEFSQALPAGALASNCQIGFRFTDAYGYGVGLDDIVIGAPVVNPWNDLSTTEKSIKLNGLDDKANYEVQVQGVCGTDATEWSDLFNFTTRESQYVVIGEALHATYYNELAYTMPNGVEGYSFESDLHLHKVFEAGDVVPAETPLVLKATAADTYELAPTDEASTVIYDDEANLLIGFLSLTQARLWIGNETGYKFYVLSLATPEQGQDPDPATVGFYWYNANGAGGFYIPNHRAYLKLSDAQANNAPGFIFDENGATSLENLKGVEGTLKFIQDGTIYILREGVIYDATGRKVRTLE